MNFQWMSEIVAAKEVGQYTTLKMYLYHYICVHSFSYTILVNKLEVSEKKILFQFWAHFCICVVYYLGQGPRGLRRGSVAARLLRLRVRIPQVARLTVSC